MPDYKYQTSIVIGHRPDGKPIRKYIQDNSKMRFDAKVRQVRALTERGGAPGRTTVEQWAWQWYRSYKEPRVGPSQRKTYETHIRLRICPVIGALPIASVKPFQIQQLVNEAPGSLWPRAQLRSCTTSCAPFLSRRKSTV